TTGDDTPLPGMGTFQIRWSASGIGRTPSAVPVPLGPRNRGQSAAVSESGSASASEDSSNARVIGSVPWVVGGAGSGRIAIIADSRPDATRRPAVRPGGTKDEEWTAGGCTAKSFRGDYSPQPVSPRCRPTEGDRMFRFRPARLVGLAVLAFAVAALAAAA